MKKYNVKGFKISKADKKAFEHYVLISMMEWGRSALDGMINKATKTIIREWLDRYRSQTNKDIPVSYSELMPAIVNMEGFKPYNCEAPEKRKAERDEAKVDEGWPNGFDVEDWQDIALKAYYGDPEQVLEDLMENKIALRKGAFYKEFFNSEIKDPNVETIPVRQDAFINHISKKSGYKNRKQREELGI